MVRLWTGMLLFMVILTACQSGQNTSDEGLEISQEQLDRLIQTQLPSGGPQQVTFPQLIAQMEAALVEQGGDTTLLYDLAKMCYQHYSTDSGTTYLQKSIDYYSQVIEIDPNHQEGRAYYNRMLAYAAAGNYEAGLNDIEAFVMVNQNRTPVNYYAMQAELLYQQGNIDRACAVFEQAKLLAEQEQLLVGDTTIWLTRCVN